MPTLSQYPSITLEGNILHPDVLQGRLDTSNNRGKANTGISEAYIFCRTMFMAYQTGLNKVSGYTATKALNEWATPFLSQLGYALSPLGPQMLNGQQFNISHRDQTSGLPIHLTLEYRVANAAETKRFDLSEKDGNKQSPHAHLQQYLNGHEASYGLLFNGTELRLLRDAAKMSRQSYVAFNLAAIFEQDLFADFSLLYLTLHKDYMPAANTAEALEQAQIEKWYLESLESSGRIREKLSNAIAITDLKQNKGKQYGDGALNDLINGLLNQNPDLVKNASLNQNEAGKKLFDQALQLIYRILFLSVVEERGLTHDIPDSNTPGTDSKEALRLRDIYMRYYSLKRLRKLVTEGEYVLDRAATNLWDDLMHVTFALFESNVALTAQVGTTTNLNLGIDALQTGLWKPGHLAILQKATLTNEVLIKFLKPLSQFVNEQDTMAPINYGALDVEELGSIYEGLLELEGVVRQNANGVELFVLEPGNQRSASGSHYTPEVLVQPLLQHSLDHLIDDIVVSNKPMDEKVKALLDIRIIDPACGSGHILLSAARRLAVAIAKLQHNTEQPTSNQLRTCLRMVISSCIYGVDLNPMALELCRMAFWLEAHEPGKPLSFLDHHLQCGNALIGLVSADELKQPIANEAYKALPGDDKELASLLTKTNKKEAADYAAATINFNPQKDLQDWQTLGQKYSTLNQKLEASVGDVEAKQKAYNTLRRSPETERLRMLADLKLAPFFIPKRHENKASLYTSYAYRDEHDGRPTLTGQQKGMAMAIADEKKFLHWFLAFPDVMTRGGFDLVVGNPPFLGGKKLSGNYGDDFLNFISYTYAPIGAVDLVTYFFRRADMVIKSNRYLSFISTNTIAEGSAREGGLDVLTSQGSSINHAVKSTRWPGRAAVMVALVTIYKGQWSGTYYLGGKQVDQITPYLDNAKTIGNPLPLKENEGKSFQGSVVLGKGFIMEPDDATKIITANPNYAKVLKPYLNGDDLNSRPDQSPSRWVINFYDWPLRRYTIGEWSELSELEKDEIKKRVDKDKFIPIAPPNYKGEVAVDYPVCLEIVSRLVKPEREKLSGNSMADNYRMKWWQYGVIGKERNNAIAGMEWVIVICRHTRYFQPTLTPNYSSVFSDATVVFALFELLSFAVLNSTMANDWMWKYGSRMGDSTLRVTPVEAFQTYPFPNAFVTLTKMGEQYNRLRKEILTTYRLGLTETYNCFHKLEPLPYAIGLVVRNYPELEKIKGKKAKDLAIASHPELNAQAARLVADIEQLRILHRDMDLAVRDAYGWQDLDLGHGFHEVEYLPENDRVRFTMSEAARAVVLERLLALNHVRRKAEEDAGLWKRDEWKLREA